MSGYEFRIVPAPRKGLGRALFAKDPSAMNLAEAVNTLADEGWTFLRSDTLPFPARTRLFFGWTTPRPVLVFRRPRCRKSSLPLGLGRNRLESANSFAGDFEVLLGGFRPLNAARAA